MRTEAFVFISAVCLLYRLLKEVGVLLQDERLFVHVLPVWIVKPLVASGGAKSTIGALFSKGGQAVLAPLGVTP